MLEILIVLLLLLALAGLVIPSASAWLGNVQSDQVRQQVVDLIKDELVESMRSRKPRVIWIASQPLASSPGASEPGLLPSGDGPSPDRPRNQPAAPAARWMLGCSPLLPAEQDAPGEAATPRSLVDLPRGWALAQAPISPATDEEGEGSDGLGSADDAPAADSAATTPSEPELGLDSGEAAQALILWPSGQIDVLIPLELTEPDGKRWKLEINPWVLAVKWVLTFDPATEATAGSMTQPQKPAKEQESPKVAEPTPTPEPVESNATPDPSQANKDEKEPAKRDEENDSNTKDRQKVPGSSPR